MIQPILYRLLQSKHWQHWNPLDPKQRNIYMTNAKTRPSWKQKNCSQKCTVHTSASYRCTCVSGTLFLCWRKNQFEEIRESFHERQINTYRLQGFEKAIVCMMFWKFWKKVRQLGLLQTFLKVKGKLLLVAYVLTNLLVYLLVCLLYVQIGNPLWTNHVNRFHDMLMVSLIA